MHFGLKSARVLRRANIENVDSIIIVVDWLTFLTPSMENPHSLLFSVFTFCFGMFAPFNAIN